ncbi:MAG: hypothetical protein AB1668_02270 [Nanoarchaeota archaeon]
MNIPIVSYIHRKLRENLEAIKKALKTGKEIEGKTQQRSFLGMFKIISGKSFQILKSKKKRRWLKPKQK